MSNCGTLISIIGISLKIISNLAISLQVCVVSRGHFLTVEPSVGDVGQRWEVHVRLADHTWNQLINNFIDQINPAIFIMRNYIRRRTFVQHATPSHIFSFNFTHRSVDGAVFRNEFLIGTTGY